MSDDALDKGETPDTPTKRPDTILVIEDEDLIRFSLRARLTQEGYNVLEAETGREGLDILERSFVDLILLDYKLPDLDGLSILKRIRGEAPGQVTIMMTAYSTIEGVVEAMQNGAYTYVKKPFDMAEMLEHVKRGLETTRLRREVERLRYNAQSDNRAPVLIGSSSRMAEVESIIQKLNQAGTSTALILGPSGTGKNVVAKRIHYTSPRANGPFLTVTCTDFSENLLESELFGHQKGAFTGAISTKTGLFELADGGTIFLDEIGDMPKTLQTKLLRFLEERTFRRVGGTGEISVNVRVIAATNKNLKKSMEDGTFRDDLYYRLTVIPIDIPQLQDRPDDIGDLAALFVDRFNKDFHKSITRLSDDALSALRTRSWPGNVRELRNVIERAMILCSGSEINVEDLPAEFFSGEGSGFARTNAEKVLGPEGLDFEAFEKTLILRALDLANQNQTAASRLLHMSRDKLRYRMEKFEINPKSTGSNHSD